MSDFKATVYHFQFPDPAGGAYSAPPDPLAALRGPTSKGRGGDETPPLHAPRSYFWIRPRRRPVYN